MPPLHELARAPLNPQGLAPARRQPLLPAKLKPERRTALKGELPFSRGPWPFEPWPFVFPAESHDSQGREPLGSQPRARSSQGQDPRWLIAKSHGTLVRSQTLAFHHHHPRTSSLSNLHLVVFSSKNNYRGKKKK